MNPLENGYVLTFEENFEGGMEKNKWEAIEKSVESHSAKKNDGDEPTHVIQRESVKHEGAKMHCRPENVAVKDGALVITADRDGDGFQGGSVVCQGVVFAHGYIEIEATLPAFQKGVWPSLGIETTSGYVYQTAYDIIAVHGDKGKNASNMYIRWTDDVYERPHAVNCMYGQKHRFYPSQETEDKLSAGPHTFGLEWSEDYVVFYCGGEEYNRIDVTPSTYKVFGEKRLSKFTAGLSIGLPNIDAPEPQADFPTEFKIHSIKLYQKDGSMLIKR